MTPEKLQRKFGTLTPTLAEIHVAYPEFSLCLRTAEKLLVEVVFGYARPLCHLVHERTVLRPVGLTSVEIPKLENSSRHDET